MGDVLDIRDAIWLTDLPDHLPRKNGKKQNLCTGFRWAGRGILAGGKRVKLRTIRIGGRLATRKTWLAEFMERLSNPQLADDSLTPSQIKREHHVAERQLVAMGI
jgi:hypothetical protein